MKRWRVVVLVLVALAAVAAVVWWNFRDALARRGIAADLRSGDAQAVETALDRLYLAYPSEADRTVVAVLFARDHANHEAVIEALERVGKQALAPRPARIALAEKRLADARRSAELRAREALYLLHHAERKDPGSIARLVPHLPATRESARAIEELLGMPAAFEMLLGLVPNPLSAAGALALLAQGIGVPGRADEVLAASGDRFAPGRSPYAGVDDDRLAVLAAALPSAPVRTPAYLEDLASNGSGGSVAALHVERAVAAGAPVPAAFFEGDPMYPSVLAPLLERWGAAELDAPRADGRALADTTLHDWAIALDDRLTLAAFAQLARRAARPALALAIPPASWVSLVDRAGQLLRIPPPASVAGRTWVPIEPTRMCAFVLDLHRLARASGWSAWVPLGEALVAVPRAWPEAGPAALAFAGELAAKTPGEPPAWTRGIAEIARDARVADPIRLAALRAAPTALDADGLAALAAKTDGASELRCLALDQLAARGASSPGLYAQLLESDDEAVVGRAALAIARGATELGPLLALIDKGAPQAEAVLPELARRGGDLAFEAIRARIGAADTRVRAAAVRALGSMGDPRAVEALLPVLADRAVPVAISQQAGQALAVLMAAERLGDVVAAIADHPSTQLKLVVAEALVARGFRGVAGVLCDVLGAEEAWERESAHALLGALAEGKDFGFHAEDPAERRAEAVARWREWAGK